MILIYIHQISDSTVFESEWVLIPLLKIRKQIVIYRYCDTLICSGYKVMRTGENPLNIPKNMLGARSIDIAEYGAAHSIVIGVTQR